MQFYNDRNNDADTQYFVIPRKHHNSIPEIPKKDTTTNLVQVTFYSCQCQMSYSTSTTSLKLPPLEKYVCFKSGGKSAHESQCSKSKAFTKFIDIIIEVESFEQQFVILKWLLRSDRLKQHIITMVIYR